MAIGIILLVIGAALLAIGIMYFKQSWDEYREQELSFPRKILIVILEVVATFTLSWCRDMALIHFTAMYSFWYCSNLFVITRNN